MKFLDTVEIQVLGGAGGNGCMSFRREKFVAKGGPDGGNGGRGGSVWLVADQNLQTLADFEYARRYSADPGRAGSGSNRNGRGGSDRELRVPCGTLVYDAETGEGFADLVEPGDRLLVARGGRGGRGNRAFSSSQRKAPRFAEKGMPGESRPLRLELRLIADFGFVGCPNAGKSSLLQALSQARPKIAAYPFTTLSPNLGVLATESERVVLADIPGLIEGAHENRGLGIAFLRHVQRTRLLLHVLDLSEGDGETLVQQWSLVRKEMEAHDPELTERPCLVIGNKTDLLDPEARERLLPLLRSTFKEWGFGFLAVSAQSGEGIPALAEHLLAFAAEHPRPKGTARLFAPVLEEAEPLPAGRRRRGRVEVLHLPDGAFRVVHPQLEEAAIRYDFDYEENLTRFSRLLRKYRVEELLVAAGAEEGDTVFIGPTSFDFSPDPTADAVEEDRDFEESTRGEGENPA